MLSRTEHTFPTRTYPYRARSMAEVAVAAPEQEEPLESGRIYRFVLGVDPTPRPMTGAEVEGLLRDPFAMLLLKRGTFPLTLRALLAAFDQFNADPAGLPQQASYVVADGGQIPWSPETASVNRLLRFAVSRAREGDAAVLISASTVLDSERQFLQLLAWDAENQVYNYYERRLGTWIWAGNSRHALEPGSRGQGPFDSHVNGSLVMKELKFPWEHWHSQAASIGDGVLAPDDPLRAEPLFRNRAGAEDLERAVVKPGIARWNRARLARSVAPDGRISDVPHFMRQVLETTTVNLASSETQSRVVRADTRLRLPMTFFLNKDALLDILELEPDIEPISVSGQLYLDSLRQYAVALTDGAFRQEGDTFFAFPVPEPAFEDVDVLAKLLERGLLTPHFAGALLMVDFPNPVFSPRRSRLLQYVPPVADVTQPGQDIGSLTVRAIEAAEPGLPPGSPEQEFLKYWRLPDGEWKASFEAQITDYFGALKSRASTQEGFDGLVRLAESRRREFRKRPLAEFRLTLPVTNIPEDAPPLEMNADGTVRDKERSQT